jgi:hypothetical protein
MPPPQILVRMFQSKYRNIGLMLSFPPHQDGGIHQCDCSVAQHVGRETVRVLDGPQHRDGGCAEVYEDVGSV